MFSIRPTALAVVLFALSVSAQPRPAATFEIASVKLVTMSGQPAKPQVYGLGAGGRFQAYGWFRDVLLIERVDRPTPN